MPKKVVSIPVSTCVPGMKVAQLITNAYGAELVAAGTILEQFDIQRLIDLGVSFVDVYNLDSEEIKENAESFKSEYKKNTQEMKLLFNWIENSNSIRIESVRGIVNDIMGSTINNRDIFHTLNEVRQVDEYTFNHSQNVGILASMLAKWAGFPPDQAKQVCYAGVLHDIGKARVPTEILNKPSKLTAEEFETMKKHSALGFEILKNNKFISEEIRLGVLMHHERINGKGYPLAIKGDKIHPYAKIIAVADVFDAMVSDRCYHKKELPFNVLEYFANQCVGHLDHFYLQTFIDKMSIYYIGERVMLSNNVEGEVVYINPRQLSRPIVKAGNEIYHLGMRNDISIADIVS